MVLLFTVVIIFHTPYLMLLLLVLNLYGFLSKLLGCIHPHLALGCFYRPPAAPSQSVHDVCDSVESMMLRNQYIIAYGDFNIDMSGLNKPISQTFHHFITLHSLTQSICSPTRYSNSCATILDLFLVSPDIPISNSSVLDHSFSDHQPIHLQIKCTVPPPQPLLITRRSFKHL